MSKTEFTMLVDEVLNEFDCKLTGLEYNEDGICRVSYDYEFGSSYGYFLVAYRFMNRARLRLRVMDLMNLLVEVDPELDLGF